VGQAHTFTVEPDFYSPFDNELELLEACKEWGLLSGKATKIKAFTYKRNGAVFPCTIIGVADKVTAVIELDNGQKHCIHPSYLKEMQAASFGQKNVADRAAGDEQSQEATDEQSMETAPLSSGSQVSPELSEPDTAAKDKPQAKPKAKKEKPAKLQLPEEKVKMTATVQEFTTVPNHFSDTDDEVIIYDAVAITEPPTEIGSAWSSHSATIKKLELEVGDVITFEAKIAAKKLTKHPVPYKINNPSKIQKQQNN